MYIFTISREISVARSKRSIISILLHILLHPFVSFSSQFSVRTSSKEHYSCLIHRKLHLPTNYSTNVSLLSSTRFAYLTGHAAQVHRGSPPSKNRNNEARLIVNSEFRFDSWRLRIVFDTAHLVFRVTFPRSQRHSLVRGLGKARYQNRCLCVTKGRVIFCELLVVAP